MSECKSKLNVDAVYLISGRDSLRKPIALERLHEQGLEPAVFDAIMIPKDPVRGCYASHLQVWRQAHSLGLSRILVFEDDVEFLREFNEVEISRINGYLDALDWAVFYLGHRPLKIHRTGDPHLIGCHSHDTHAYIMNLGRVNELLKGEYQEAWKPVAGIAAIDGKLARLDKCYALYPMLCIQDQSMCLGAKCKKSPPSTSSTPSTSPLDSESINPQLAAECDCMTNPAYQIYGQWKLYANEVHHTFGSGTGDALAVLPFLVVAVLLAFLLVRW